MTDITRVPVGAGSPEGVNSAYILPSASGVVDPGPPTEKAWSALREGIAETGLELEDVNHIIVTHWHMDHAGLACRLAKAADATIHMHTEDAPLLSEYADAREHRLDRDSEVLSRWGVPKSVRTRLLEADQLSSVPNEYPVRSHEDGDVVAGLEFIHTAGHTKGHTSLTYGESLFVGDLLLPTYTPNVGGSDTRMDDPLKAYLASIDRVNDCFDQGEPGHGTTIDIDDAVAESKSHHRERAEKAFRSLDVVDKPTPWNVARELFGKMDGIHAKFGAGEAAAHLQRLTELNVVERHDGFPVRFKPRADDYPVGLNLTP